MEGNQEFDQVAQELDVPFKRTGKLVVGFDEKDRENILKFKKIGEINGVRGMEMIDRKRMDEIDRIAGGNFAMYVPSSGILDPMQYTIALAENACANGVCFRFGHKVERISRLEDGWMLHTSKGDVKTKWVINCLPNFRHAGISGVSGPGL